MHVISVRRERVLQNVFEQLWPSTMLELLCMERLAVDVMGPLPATDTGNRYLLVCDHGLLFKVA